MATASGGHEEVTAHNFHGSRVALSDRASSLHAARWVLLRPVAWRRDTADSLEKWNVPLSGGGVCDCCTSGFLLCSSLPLPLPLLTHHKRGRGLEEVAISAFGSVLERPLTPDPRSPGVQSQHLLSRYSWSTHKGQVAGDRVSAAAGSGAGLFIFYFYFFAASAVPRTAVGT